MRAKHRQRAGSRGGISYPSLGTHLATLSDKYTAQNGSLCTQGIYSETLKQISIKPANSKEESMPERLLANVMTIVREARAEF